MGVELKFNIIERSLFSLRTNNADFDLTTWIMEPSQLKYRTDSPASGWFLTAGHWAPLWRNWYQSNGESGEEPVGIAKEMLDLGHAMRNELDDDKWHEMGKEFMMMFAENVFRHRHGGLAAAPDDLQKEHHEPVRGAGVDQRHRGQLPRARLPVVDQGVA